MAEDNRKQLYIIDGHSHIYAAYYAPMRQNLTSPTGEPTKATYIFTTIILGLIQRKKPDMLMVAMDSKAPSFRAELYADYKATRPPMPDDLPPQIARIDTILDAMRIPVLRLEGYEADDVIGTIARKAAAEGPQGYIWNKDKDMLQLINNSVCTYDIQNDICFDEKAMIEQMGIRPEQFIDVLALQGDTSDNVPGVPDVGPKTAIGWIKEYGSLENLYAHANMITGKRGDNLRNNEEKAYLSKQLVTIDCEAPVDVDYGQFAYTGPDKTKLTKLFTELGFTRLLTQLGLSQEAVGEEIEVEKIGEPASLKTVKHDYNLIDTADKFEQFLVELNKQKLFAIDTETTDISAMRAELVGISFSWKKHTGYYLAVKGPLGSKCLDIKTVREKLNPILTNENIEKIGQNIKYDKLVLKNAGLELKGKLFDTMVATYCLDPQRQSHSMNEMAKDFLHYGWMAISVRTGKGTTQLTFDMVATAAACEYSAEDADITLQLYEYLNKVLEKQTGLKELFETVEMPLVSCLMQMEYNGVSLDMRLLKSMSGELAEQLHQLSEKIYQQAGSVFNIDSPAQLAGILFDSLGLQSIRIGKTGRSTDAAVLEELVEQHPVVELILQYRQLSKLQNTYVDKLGTLINPRTGRLHTSFNQTVTATGRLSSSDPNLQNIPIRTEFGKKIRGAFVPARKGDCILSADYSQIELRLLAHFSKDVTLRTAFAEDRDIHSFVASQIYNCPIEQVTSQMRSSCKAVNFGIIYGQGAFGLSRTIGISQSEAKQFIDDYFRRYSSIRQFMDNVVASAKDTGYAETILHRRRKIVDINSRSAMKQSQARRLAINTVIQGSAADLIKVAMINIQRKIDQQNLPVKMILQVHDELVFELPTAKAEEYSKWISDEMASAIKLDVPLKVDVTYGSSWLGGE